MYGITLGEYKQKGLLGSMWLLFTPTVTTAVCFDGVCVCVCVRVMKKEVFRQAGRHWGGGLATHLPFPDWGFTCTDNRAVKLWPMYNTCM